MARVSRYILYVLVGVLALSLLGPVLLTRADDPGGKPPPPTLQPPAPENTPTPGGGGEQGGGLPGIIGEVTAPDPTKSTINPPTASTPNNDTPVLVTVTVRDTANATVANAPVTISVTPSLPPTGVSIGPLSGTTAPDGTFVVTVKSVAALSAIPSVTLVALVDIGGGNYQQVPGQSVITFTQSPAVLANSTVTPATQNVEANGTAQASITVELRDIVAPAGNPVPGKNVTIAPVGTPPGLAYPSGQSLVTGSDGRATFTVTSTVQQTVQFTVTNTSDGFALPNVTVVFTPASPDASKSAAVAGPPTSAPADDTTTIPLVVTARNAGNNPIQGANIVISGFPAVVTVSPASAVTDVNGQATFTVKSRDVVNNLALTASITVTGAGSVNVTANTINFTAAPADQAQSSITGTQTGPGDGVTPRSITVTLRNKGGFPVVGKSVSLTSDQPATTIITPAGGVTNASGQITFTVTSTFKGLVNFATNVIDGFTLSTTITFDQPPTDPALSTVVRTPASVEANGVDEVLFTINLKDKGGNPVPGRTVSLTTVTPPPAGATVNIAADPAGTNPANGVFAFKVTGQSLAAFSIAFQATVGAPDNVTLNTKPTVSFTAPKADNSKSTVNVVGETPPTILPVQADGVATATVRVTLLDKGNTPLPGKEVELTPNPATGVGINPVSRRAITNSSGVADFIVRSTSIALVQFSAVVLTDTVTLTDTASVNFIDAPADPTKTTITVVPPSVVANGIAESTITVVLRNAGNNFAVGKQLELEIASGATNPGAISILPSPFQATNAVGQAVFRVRSTVSQNVTFNVRDITDAIASMGTAVVNFTPSTGPVDGTKSTINVTPATANANGTDVVTITAILRDATGTVVQGKTPTLITNPNPLPAGVTLSAASGPSDNEGKVTWTVTSTTPLTITFSATVDSALITNTPPGGSNQVVFNLVGSPIDPNNSSVIVTNDPGVADGATPITVTVTLRNAANAVLPGLPVTLTSSRGVTDTITPPSGTTDAGGQVVFQVTSSMQGQAQVTAVGGTPPSTVTLTQRPFIVFNPVQPPTGVSATNSTVQVGPSAPADGTSTITVTVILRNGQTPPQVVPGKVVTIGTSRGSLVDTVSPLSAISDANGQAVFTIKSTTAGTGTVTAVGDGVTLATKPTYTFTPVASPVDPANSTIVANPVSAPADGATPITVTVTLRDAGNLPLAGLTVAINTTPSVQVTTINAVTDANGRAVFELRSTTPQPSVTITALGDTAIGGGVPLNVPAVVTFTAVVPVDAAQSTVSASPTSVPADGTTPITVTVTARDAAGNPLQGRAVTISANPSNGVVITPATATTNAQGVATFTVTSTLPSASTTITAVAGGVTILQTATVSFTGSGTGVDPATSTVTASPLSAPADGTTPITITVTARDAANNPLAGQSVSISAAPNTVTITGNPTVTNAQGVATFQVRSTTPGSYVITAVAAGITLNQKPTITFSGGGTVDPNTSTVTQTGSPQPADNVSAITITVTVRDASSNPLPNKQVTISAAPNTVNITPASATTNAQGVATFTVTSSTAGTYTISVVADGVTLTNPVTIQFTQVGGTPDLSITKSANPVNFLAGQTGQFVLAIQNVGTGPTSGTITVTDTLPTLTTFASAAGTGFTCQNVGTLVSCTRTTPMAAAELVGITINVTAQAVTTQTSISNTASVLVTGDTNPANNNSTVVLSIIPNNPLAISPSLSTVTASPSTAPADNNTRVAVNVMLRNFQSQPVVGASVTLQPNPSNGLTIEAGNPLVSDANGMVSFQVRSNVAQTVTFTVLASNTAGTVTLDNKPLVTYTGGSSGAVSATNSTVTTNYTSIPADNTTFATVTVTLKDANNNVVSGKTVTLSANPPSSTVSISPTSGTSGADGVVNFQVKASAQGSATFAAQVNDNGQVIFINQTVSITFTAPGVPPVPSGTGTPAGTGTPTGTLVVPTGPIEGTVVAWRLRVRQGPGLDFPILGLLRYGQKVSIIAKTVRGNWYQIRLTEGTAWVSAFWVRVSRTSARNLPVVSAEPGTAPLIPVPGELLPQEGQGVGRVNTYLLRVRSGPGTQYEQIGLLREGTDILLLGISPDRRWYLFKTTTGEAWTSALYVKLLRINGNRLPVIEATPRP